MLNRVIVGFLLVLCNPWFCKAQEDKKLPSISVLRAEENYQFLNGNDSLSFFLKGLKFIPINSDGSAYLSLGGEYRPRVEHFTNPDYSTGEETYYSQRLDFHFSLQLKERFRIFTELYHGYTSAGVLILESEEIDFHQAFLDWIPIQKENASVKIRLGRQEIGYGASRLVGIREGPNMRRAFDMARVLLRRKQAALDLFYGKEVRVLPQAFDNTSNLGDNDAIAPMFWGAYYSRPLLNGIGKLDIYYLGFHSNAATFNDLTGEELRHSIGLRSFGKKDKLSFNTEFIFQFGEISDSRIIAYNVETDWRYTLFQSGWQPTIGLKIDWSSGDNRTGDDRLGTFNPLFVNPAIYSLAAVNTPANLTSLHPNITFRPLKNLSIYLDYALFFRTQKEDGLYLPPRFLRRPTGSSTARFIGDALGLQINYEVNRFISFDLRSSYFMAGSFIEQTGDAENIFYIAPTANFKF